MKVTASASWLLFFMLISLTPAAIAQNEHRQYHRDRKILAVQGLSLPMDGIENPVSNELLNAAVNFEAKKRWDVFAIGDPIPCCGRDGKLIAFQVPVAIGSKDFPPVLSPLPPDEIEGGRLKDKNLWATDEFWTFIVSASENQFPVPVYFQGLPPYLVTYHKAFELARNALMANGVILDRYYCLQKGDFFSFISSSNNVLINAYSLKIENNSMLKNEIPKGERPSAATEDKRKEKETLEDQIKKEWLKIKRNQ